MCRQCRDRLVHVHLPFRLIEKLSRPIPSRPDDAAQSVLWSDRSIHRAYSHAGNEADYLIPDHTSPLNIAQSAGIRAGSTAHDLFKPMYRAWRCSIMQESAILIVEDTRDILDVLCMLLEHEGYVVYKAECCDSAFEILSKNRVDLIITDLMLPGMTGLEFIHKVRRVVNYDLIPVVAMSAFDHKYLNAAEQAGAIRILHKPEDLDQLLPLVHQLLRPRAAGFH